MKCDWGIIRAGGGEDRGWDSGGGSQVARKQEEAHRLGNNMLDRAGPDTLIALAQGPCLPSFEPGSPHTADSPHLLTRLCRG